MKKVLPLFAVLMAVVTLVCIKQATGIIKCSNDNGTTFAVMQMKSTDTSASPGGMYQCMVLPGIQPTADHC